MQSALFTSFLSLVVSLTSLLFGGLVNAKERPATHPVGIWQVVQVGVDDADQAHWLYRPNDPRLLHRVLTISDAALFFNDGRGRCEHPVWHARNTDLGSLIKQYYARPRHPARQRWPKLENFSLRYANQLQVIQYSVKCANNDPKGEWQHFWLAAIDTGTSLLHFDSTSLLKIVKTTARPPSPSYDCKKAQLPAEKTICQDHGLAGYDRSIHSAIKTARERKPDAIADLVQEQRAWLNERNKCQTDIECLQQKMWFRLEELGQWQ